MQNINQLKDKACNLIEKNKEEIINVAKEIYKHPETGYREKVSTQIMENNFKKLGLNIKRDIAITGVKATYSSNYNKYPHITVLGELDAVICKDHPDADKKTKAVHACGHNNQLGVLFGVAYSLVKTGIVDKLGGIIDFIAVPAEEFIEIEFREKLIKEGKISYIGGKQELINRGYFDEIDIAMMVHSLDIGDLKDVIVGPTSVGFLLKTIEFIDNKNSKIDFIEEKINNIHNEILLTNKEMKNMNSFNKDINDILKGKKIKKYVKGKTVDSIFYNNKKINKFIKEKIVMQGLDLKIKDIPGYLPLKNNNELIELFINNLDGIIPDNRIIKEKSLTGSFDMGDLSQILPVLHPVFSGVEGKLHSKNFKTKNYEMAVIKPAKALSKTIIDILDKKDRILNRLEDSPFNKKDYLKLLNEMRTD